jgi:hypothetical protein
MEPDRREMTDPPGGRGDQQAKAQASHLPDGLGGNLV